MTKSMNSGEPELTSRNSIFIADLQQAQELIDEAMRYTGINQNTAPVRYESAKQGVKYAIYTSLGFTGVVGLLSEDYIASKDANFKDEIRTIRQMARFEEFHQKIFGNNEQEVINEK